jgi:hypothetical protein
MLEKCAQDALQMAANRPPEIRRANALAALDESPCKLLLKSAM